MPLESKAIELFLPTMLAVSIDVHAQLVTLQPVPLRDGALGYLLLRIDPNSAAERASLMIGDLLIAASGKPFATADDLSDTLDSAGETLDLQFLRGDRRRTRSTAVRLRARSPEAA